MSSISGHRSMKVEGLKTLQHPNEGGSKQAYEDFLKILKTHVSVWDEGDKLEDLLEWMEEPILSAPKPLTVKQSEKSDKVEEYKYELDVYRTRVRDLEKSTKVLFSLMLGNMSEEMKAKIAQFKSWTSKMRERDLMWLLERLDDVMEGFEEGVKPNELAMDDQLTKILLMKQDPDEAVVVFVKRFKREVRLYEKHGGRFLWGQKQEDEMDDIYEEEMEKEREDLAAGESLSSDTKKILKRNAKKRVKEKALAYAIMKRAEKKKYGDLFRQMSNDYLQGVDKFPTSVSEAIRILTNFKQPFVANSNRFGARSGSPRPGGGGTGNEGGRSRSVSFLQASGSNFEVKYCKGSNGSFYPAIVCRLCGIKGHYKSDCPICKDETGARLESTTAGQE